MKTIDILKQLLLQEQNSKFSFLYDKYSKGKDKSKIPFETLKLLILTDPTTRYQSETDFQSMNPKDFDSNVKAGSYSEWIIKKYLQPEIQNTDVESPSYNRDVAEYRRLFIEDLDKLNSDLKKYDRFKGRLPLESRQIQNMSRKELSSAVSEFKLSKTEKSSKEEEMTKSNPFQFPGSEIIHTGPKWTVVKISDTGKVGKDAACYFGGYYDIDNEFDETNWCTSKVDGSYFDGYIKKGPLYVFLDNTDSTKGKKTGLPKTRYQLHLPSNQFMNRRDEEVDFISFLTNEGEEVKEMFKDYFMIDIAGNSSNINVEFPDSPEAKFIRIYSLEEFINKLPENLISLHMYNYTKQEYNFSIPENIGKFKNMTILRINKLVSSIPNSICELKNLELLNLNGNTNLKKLPDCLVNLDELFLVSLNDTPVNLSDTFKNKFEKESGSDMYISKTKEL